MECKLCKKEGDEKCAWPKPDILKIDDENWENTLKTMIQEKKPIEGWPDKPKEKSKSMKI